MNIVSYGGGTNSTAMLIGMFEHNERPDLIMFADTGGEKPHTYEYVKLMNKWCKYVGFPEVVVVKDVSTTLEKDCLDRKVLPSVAFGNKSCSQRFKTQPQSKFVNNWEPAKDVWEKGEKIIKLIGFDADELGRAEHYEDNKYINRYPLVEWNWAREECVEAIKRSGLPQPGKSSCFFCPNSKQSEIRELKAQYPELAQRAINMESNATEVEIVKGLGRNWSWTNLLKTDEMFDFPERFNDFKCVECIG